MRFAINSDHKDFYHKNQYIIFEDVLNKEQIHTLTTAIESTLCKQANLTPELLKKKTGSEIFKIGHDLFRKNDSIKKSTQKSALIAIAAELFELWSFRVAFDQLICTEKASSSPFEKELSLEEMSSLSPLAGAMLIQLKDMPTESPDFPLPKTAGSLLFFSPDLTIPWPTLFATPGLCFFLVVFGKDKTFFRAGTPDPHAVDLKNLGYVFGDKVNDHLHPILFRNTCS